MVQQRAQIRFRMLIVIGLMVTLLSGCMATSAGSGLAIAPMDDMPLPVQSAAAPIREAYQFAAANASVLKHIPCYCGCDKLGHTSNRDCYLSASDSESRRKYDLHAVNCAICINITHDVMRLMQSGQPDVEIRAFVDQTYSKYGPSTQTP